MAIDLNKTSIAAIFKQYLSSKVPKKQTNVFYLLFNGIDSMFSNIETLLRINKRERNILTAVNVASLRTLAASNGYEPKLKVPSSGLLQINVSQKLFSRAGHPLYLPPYATFTDKTTGLKYYYNSNKTLKLTNTNILVPVVEGELQQAQHRSTGAKLETIYISNDNLAHDSITISVGNTNYSQVDSFFDSENMNDNKQFLVKFSTKPDSPIVIYVKGTAKDDLINIVYRITYGSAGNISYNTVFDTESILTSDGQTLEISDDEIEITNNSGFEFGSNGSDVNSLRAAIGFNHGVQMLFDVTSYTNFINRYSTVLLQGITLNENKAIKNLFISKKQYPTNNVEILVTQYKDVISKRLFKFSDAELSNLGRIISEKEFSLSSHNIYNARTNSFAFQILFNNENDMSAHSKAVEKMIYESFAKFLYDKQHIINIDNFFDEFMKSNSVNFDYTLFNEDIESRKLNTLSNIQTPRIISHDSMLPILNGTFNISNANFTPVRLFFDINFAIKS